MKYLKRFNEGSSSYYNDEKFIKDLECDIEQIFVDVLDNEYNIDFHLTDYAGNISSIRLSSKNRNNPVPIKVFLESLHDLYDYIKSVGSRLYEICINGKWIVYIAKRLTWEFIEQTIIEKHSVINSVAISLSPFERKSSSLLSESVNDKETLEELCYDLTDYGRFKIDIRPMELSSDIMMRFFGIDNVHTNYIFGSLGSKEIDVKTFTYKEVVDVVHRIKDYLGDKFIKSMFATPMSTDMNDTPWIDEDKLNIRDMNNIRDFIIIFKR